MNYALALSRKLERHLSILQDGERAMEVEASRASTSDGSHDLRVTGTRDDEESAVAIEERALMAAVEEIWEESGKRWKPWAKNGKACRLGEIILLVDSDTVVPEVLISFSSCNETRLIHCSRTVFGTQHGRWQNALLWPLSSTSPVCFHLKKVLF